MAQFLIAIIILALAIQFWPITLFIIIVAIFASNLSKEDKNRKTKTYSTPKTGYASIQYGYGNSYRHSNIDKMTKFYGKNETLTLFGHTIQNPLVYMSDANITGSDLPHLILTKLPVSHVSCSVNLGYWPSYSGLEENERGIYLKWLQEGKTNPEINIGFVFIYFYGLEYRAISEEKDLNDILFEVMRLYEIYADKSGSFSSYSLKFIQYLIFKIKNFSEEEKNRLIEFINKIELSYYFDKASIFTCLLNDFEIQKDDVYKVANCSRELQYAHSTNYNSVNVFQLYFTKLIENEIQFVELKNNETYEYRTASSLMINAKVKYNKVSISNNIKELWNKAYADLNKFVHTTQRKKADGTSQKLTKVERYNYLPFLLKEHFPHPKEKDITKLLKDNKSKIETVSKLVNIMGLPYEEKISLKQSKTLAESYNSAGYLVEPDARIINKCYKTDDKVIIYKPSEIVNFEEYNFENYSTASIFTDLGLKVSVADNNICDKEIKYILDFVTEKFDIDEITQERLMHRILLAREQDINISGLLKKITENAAIEDIQSLGKYFVCIATSDGVLLAEELEVVKKYFKQMRLTEEYLESLLTEFTSIDTPILIKESESVAKSGSIIPKPTESISDEVQINKAIILDKEKISDILADTSNVQRVLHNIFSAENKAECIVEEPDEVEVVDENYLESNYIDFINFLLEKSEWAEFELLGICQSLGLMLNSAIDKINEWTDENFGDFLIEEDGDKYQINNEIAAMVKNQEKELELV